VRLAQRFLPPPDSARPETFWYLPPTCNRGPQYQRLNDYYERLRNGEVTGRLRGLPK
jgi:hypothetical protein